MLWNPTQTRIGAQEKCPKSAQIRVKTRLNDTIFQHNINSINQLQRNAQYHPPFTVRAFHGPFAVSSRKSERFAVAPIL